MVTQHGDDPCRHLRWKPVVLNYVATDLHIPASGADNAVETWGQQPEESIDLGRPVHSSTRCPAARTDRTASS